MQQRSPPTPRGAERKGWIQDHGAQGALDPGSTPAPANKSTEFWGSFCTYLFRRVRCDPGAGQRVQQSLAEEDKKGHHRGGSRAWFPPGLKGTWPWRWPVQLQGGRTDGQAVRAGESQRDAESRGRPGWLPGGLRVPAQLRPCQEGDLSSPTRAHLMALVH